MDDGLLKLGFGSEFRVGVDRVGISGEFGEGFYILGLDGSGDAGFHTNFQLVEGKVTEFFVIFGHVEFRDFFQLGERPDC